jgi:hypothetical protein
MTLSDDSVAFFSAVTVHHVCVVDRKVKLGMSPSQAQVARVI